MKVIEERLVTMRGTPKVSGMEYFPASYIAQKLIDIDNIRVSYKSVYRSRINGLARAQ